jgi:hypothetical protein
VPSEKEAEEVNKLLNELLKNTFEMLRVYVDEETITAIKNHDHCIEVNYKSKKEFNSGFLGKISLNKILIPLSGDYSGNTDKNLVTLITGEDSYSSGPLMTEGSSQIKHLLNMLQKNKTK